MEVQKYISKIVFAYISLSACWRIVSDYNLYGLSSGENCAIVHCYRALPSLPLGVWHKSILVFGSSDFLGVHLLLLQYIKKSSQPERVLLTWDFSPNSTTVCLMNWSRRGKGAEGKGEDRDGAWTPPCISILEAMH
jgi:hypothetical protein